MLQVKEVAESHGYTISRLQQETALPWTTISRYWKDQVDRIDMRVLRKIAQVLGVKPKDLIADE